MYLFVPEVAAASMSSWQRRPLFSLAFTSVHTHSELPTPYTFLSIRVYSYSPSSSSVGPPQYYRSLIDLYLSYSGLTTRKASTGNRNYEHDNVMDAIEEIVQAVTRHIRDWMTPESGAAICDRVEQAISVGRCGKEGSIGVLLEELVDWERRSHPPVEGLYLGSKLKGSRNVEIEDLSARAVDAIVRAVDARYQDKVRVVSAKVEALKGCYKELGDTMSKQRSMVDEVHAEVIQAKSLANCAKRHVNDLTRRVDDSNDKLRVELRDLKCRVEESSQETASCHDTSTKVQQRIEVVETHVDDLRCKLSDLRPSALPTATTPSNSTPAPPPRLNWASQVDADPSTSSPSSRSSEFNDSKPNTIGLAAKTSAPISTSSTSFSSSLATTSPTS
ncbi:hypothetical protein NMY22_g16483 [Coprinellus aureogranulatus]|nr:hypothetical protein NMY22_g16483 [Coprinellus aureogranulatus]